MSAIALSVASDVEQLQQQKAYTHATLLGISLGCVTLALTAEKLRHFNDVILVVPGDYLAHSLWDGWRTQQLRNVYKHQGYTLADLERAWHILAPAAHADVLCGHKVDVILAEKDRFIPNKYGRGLVESLRAAHVRVTFTECPFGHMATILSYGRA